MHGHTHFQVPPRLDLHTSAGSWYSVPSLVVPPVPEKIGINRVKVGDFISFPVPIYIPYTQKKVLLQN